MGIASSEHKEQSIPATLHTVLLEKLPLLPGVVFMSCGHAAGEHRPAAGPAVPTNVPTNLMLEHWVWLPSLTLQVRLGRTDAGHVRIVTDQPVVQVTHIAP
jgi:hypothetical protein